MLDIPQIISHFDYNVKKYYNEILLEFKKIHMIRDKIVGIHLWGYDGRPHIGNLDSLFGDFKHDFLEVISEALNDGKSRFLIPEVNATKQEVFDTIIKDLRVYFEFVPLSSYSR